MIGKDVDGRLLMVPGLPQAPLRVGEGSGGCVHHGNSFCAEGRGGCGGSIENG